MSSRHDHRDRDRNRHRDRDASRESGRGTRPTSRSDRAAERSPKKSRRDEKPSADHTQSVVNDIDNELPSDGLEVKDISAGVKSPADDRKDNINLKADRYSRGARHSFESREGARGSRPYLQHSHRSSAGQGGQHYNRRANEHSRDGGQKEHNSDRAEDRANARRFSERGEHTLPGKNVDTVWKHDGYYRLESEDSRPKKRPAFREEKIPVEPESVPHVSNSDPKLAEPDRRPMHVSRWEERRNYPQRGTEKFERPFRKTDERNEWRHDPSGQKSDAYRNGHQMRGQFQGRGTNGRDRFDGRYSEGSSRAPAGIQVDKWKHDLFDEANKSPSPKNEEEQIAKVEALLAL